MAVFAVYAVDLDARGFLELLQRAARFGAEIAVRAVFGKRIAEAQQQRLQILYVVSAHAAAEQARAEQRRFRRGRGFILNKRQLIPVFPAAIGDLRAHAAVFEAAPFDRIAVSDIEADMAILVQREAGCFRKRADRAPRPVLALGIFEHAVG